MNYIGVDKILEGVCKDEKWSLLISTMVLATGLAACGNENDEATPATEPDGVKEEENLKVDEADNAELSDADEMGDESLSFVTVDLKNGGGNSVGTVELNEENDSVRVKVNANGLPEGTHGFHFHEFGKCEAPEFESAAVILTRPAPTMD